MSLDVQLRGDCIPEGGVSSQLGCLGGFLAGCNQSLFFPAVACAFLLLSVCVLFMWLLSLKVLGLDINVFAGFAQSLTFCAHTCTHYIHVCYCFENLTFPTQYTRLSLVSQDYWSEPAKTAIRNRQQDSNSDHILN